MNLAGRQPTGEDIQGFAKVVRRRRNDVEQQHAPMRNRVDHDVGAVENQGRGDDTVAELTNGRRARTREPRSTGRRDDETTEEVSVRELLDWYPDEVGGQMSVSGIQ